MSEHSSYTSGSGLSCGDNEGPIDGWLGIRPRIPLPRQPNADGRPVWEPPIFDYTDLIGEEYDQKRKTVQEYTNDVAKTTDFLDADIEVELLQMYYNWSCRNEEGSWYIRKDGVHDNFFYGLSLAINLDLLSARDKFYMFKFLVEPNDDGTYTVYSHE